MSSLSMSRCRRGSRKTYDFQNEYPLLAAPIANAEYIPLRLSPQERKVQRLMRGIILASSYTDKVDSASSLKHKNREMLIVKELTNVLTGLIVGLDMRKAAPFMRDHEFRPYQGEISAAIEMCRRYKMMNPDLLRTDYVKFLYMIQDAVQNDMAREALGFNVVKELVTVGRYCKAHNIKNILQDAELPHCITPVPFIKDREVLNRCLRSKDVAVGKLVSHYARQHGLQEDKVEVVVRSLNDANCFSNDNVETSERLLELLRQHFTPTSCTELTSLAIDEGADGSRLTHNHRMQYIFVLQSLSLWKNICRNMYILWAIAEEDMLNPNEKYELRMTGQGLQRVQKAPNLYRAIQRILQETKEELGEWVGSERIHLGDDQVPNAFHFIDKYGQVSRIIIPILRTIDYVDHLKQNAEHAAYLREVWGGAEQAKRAILRDFFRHGFDGSGGDNMDDAGSCIDGRLTSAWNWCNNIRFKAFYPLFLFSGFSSFDGDMST
ncbi:hypothetical protein JKF63_01418 [Porcisia hertigi]|uniref:Non-canonical E2 ubiquitin-conjugating enzyme C-terminal domain-containing protein n=1 Tax=Porcisia hertigi TaxID=2761500 RepID=A0A836IEE5_9TRYP|nr:hypothetical protein JKF63_01418 [Porcisia hertigi]